MFKGLASTSKPALELISVDQNRGQDRDRDWDVKDIGVKDVAIHSILKPSKVKEAARSLGRLIQLPRTRAAHNYASQTPGEASLRPTQEARRWIHNKLFNMKPDSSKIFFTVDNKAAAHDSDINLTLDSGPAPTQDSDSRLDLHTDYCSTPEPDFGSALDLIPIE
ncbi:hypothetical protein EVAR_17315_1 [Eumeta japonica]|uniref:Uncharacterized protein n=1 Tax=Eumeta variegata TaxID=151549 RepID=A0A4C1TTQ8_EUMVA|nr:hypothetical protein EVAR_17315_1 [Eumeta japonica]